MPIFGLFSDKKEKGGKKSAKKLSSGVMKAKRTMKKKAKTCEFC